MINLRIRLKIHHLAEGGTPQADIAAQCGVGLRSAERIVTEPGPTREELLADGSEGTSRQGVRGRANGSTSGAAKRIHPRAAKGIQFIVLCHRDFDWLPGGCPRPPLRGPFSQEEKGKIL